MDKLNKETELTKIPSVNKLLQNSDLMSYQPLLRQDIKKRIIQETLAKLRNNISKEGTDINEDTVVGLIKREMDAVLKPSLKAVINATGIILNTNLGRAPLGESLLDEIYAVIEGYSNIEFDLDKGQRGSRHKHLKKLIRLILNCEDSIVVNNNAAALFLTLTRLAQGGEVIVSRGELVEIGGSFRIPEIIAGSGATLVEVGTTNKTKLQDYEKSINEKTVAILKVHKSNYYIGGFTEEVSLKDITALARDNRIFSIFDLGTGLADVKLVKELSEEPDLRSAFDYGTDIITFSCDKLLGGPQAGIIAGKADLITEIAKHPLMRVLRVDKLIMAALYSALRNLLFTDDEIKRRVPIFNMLNREMAEITLLAQRLTEKLKKINGLQVSIIDNQAQCGGGTLPDYSLPSKAVLVETNSKELKEEDLYHALLLRDKPIVGILREGRLLFDTLTLRERDIDEIAVALSEILVVN